MKALITGGAGFIGSHLAEALLADGEQVTIIDDLSTGRFANIEHLTANPRFSFAIESITNQVVLDRLVSECDIIFHLAAAVGVELIVSKPIHVLETNILGTETVLRTANRYRCRLLLASTSEIYGKSEAVPFREDADRVLGPTTRNRWSYSCSKAMDEFLALAYWKERALPCTIVRLFNTVGPRQTGRYGMVVPRFIRQALEGKPITVYGDGKQTRCFADVEDVVRGILALGRHEGAIGEVFNVGNNHEISIGELAHKVRALTGSRSELVTIPYGEAYEEGFEDMRRRVPDLTKIKSLVTYEPRVALDETLRRIVTWFCKEGGLSGPIRPGCDAVSGGE
jgi:UDP-glucose 4-epimerase